MVSYQHGYTQITSSANMDHEELLIDDILVTKKGFVYVYLTNESAIGNVYFDDMEVTVKESAVIQEDDYYPFGLAFNSWQRSIGKEDNFLYQGKEWQTDLGINFYDFEWRQYDPVLGRTSTLDPHGYKYSSLSPYSWVANNPISVIDPDGRDIIFSANSITFTNEDAQILFSSLKRSSSNNPSEGPGDEKKKKKEDNNSNAFIGVPVLASWESATSTIKTAGSSFVGFALKTLGLTVSFVLSGTEAGKGSAFINRLSQDEEGRLYELQNKSMAEGLDQAEESEYQELLDLKYPHGNPFEQTFEKMRQGNNQKKNQEVISLYKEFGITDKDAQRKIHDMITGKNLTRDEIKDVIKDFLNKL